MNSNGDSASPWNMPLWIVTYVKLLPYAVNSTFQVFMIFSIKFMTISDILYFFRQFIINICGNISLAFCSQSRPLLDFSDWYWSRLWSSDLRKITLLCLWILFGMFSVPQGTIRGLLASKSHPLFVMLIFSLSSVGRLWVCCCIQLFLERVVLDQCVSFGHPFRCSL